MLFQSVISAILPFNLETFARGLSNSIPLKFLFGCIILKQINLKGFKRVKKPQVFLPGLSYRQHFYVFLYVRFSVLL